MDIYMIVWYLVSSMSNFMAIWASTKCFELKVTKKLYYPTFYIIWTVPLMLLAMLGEPWSNIRPISSVIIPLITAPFLLKGRKLMIIIFFVINQLLDFILDLLLCFLILAIDPDFLNVQELEIYTTNRIITTLIFLLMALPLKYIYYKLWNRLVNKEKYEKINSIYLMFPIGQSVVMLGMVYRNSSSASWFGLPAISITIFGMLILGVVDFIFLFYLADIGRNKQLKQEIERMEYAYNVEQEHYRLIESKRYEIAKIRHDIRNQLVSIKQLVNTRNYEEADKVIKGIEKTLDETVEYNYCSIPIINAVIQQKKQQSEQNAIRFEADITISDAGVIEPAHLCSIFSNLLDNAIHANQKLPDGERYIKLFAQNKQGHIVISTENPTAENGRKSLDPSKSKGYGLKILKDISEKYSGQFEISIDNNVCRVIISVCIQADKCAINA